MCVVCAFISGTERARIEDVDEGVEAGEGRVRVLLECMEEIAVADSERCVVVLTNDN